MDELERARETIRVQEIKKFRLSVARALFGDQWAICDKCLAIVVDTDAHRDWHARTDGPHYEQGVGR